jgi:hypothetical protein
MNTVELDLRNSNNQIITLVCEVYDNPLAELWLNALHENLQKRLIFKKHACFLGWCNNKNRTWENLCDDINENLNKLHTLFPTKVDKIIVDSNKFDSNFFNYTHQIFANLLGNHKNVNDEFRNADIFGRWEIVRLNHLSHELQAYVENKSHMQSEIIKPFLNCYFYNGVTKEIPLELNKFFTIGNKWGEIYIGSIDVGKNFYDAFNDQDNDVDDTHLMNLSVGTGEFNIHFSEYIFKPKKMEQFKNWLLEKNINISDPNLRLGTGKIGIFKYIVGFENLDRQEILNLISQYDDVYKIRIKNNEEILVESIYDYTRYEPELEIEQLR